MAKIDVTEVERAGIISNTVASFTARIRILEKKFSLQVKNILQELVSSSDKDVEVWKKGAEVFKVFWATMDDQEREVMSGIKGPLQALFLGERPAVLNVRQDLSSKKDFLEDCGLKLEGDMIYNPKFVRQVIEKYPQYFDGLGETEDHVMKNMSKASLTELDSQRGLLLGFPLNAVMEYDMSNKFEVKNIVKNLMEVSPEGSEHYDFLEINFFGKPGKKSSVEKVTAFIKEMMESNGISMDTLRVAEVSRQIRWLSTLRTINIYGITWVEHDFSEESEILQQRLKKAFRKSGILNQNFSTV